jgi:proteic killer suppression protein
MIVSFGSKDTEKIWIGIVIKKPSREIQEIARRKLRMLHNSIDIQDLRIPPSNRLEKLSGNLKD